MVICQICQKQLKRINIFHLKTHKIKNEKEYLSLYPTANLFDENYIHNISNGTKLAMNNDEIKNKLRWKRTDEDNRKNSERIKKLWDSGFYQYDTMFNDERNKKVSEKKKEWWEGKDSKKLMKKWMSGYIGSEKHIKMCKENQKKATLASLSVRVSSEEKKFEEFLKSESKKYEKQFYVGQYPFDFYIPDENLLIEIDGTFYHPLTEKECIYNFQKHNFFRDKRKDKVALENGYRLKRIRV